MPSFSRPQHGRRETTMLSRGLEKNGMVGAWHGQSMARLNQTRPHCVNQMGKTHSKPLAARHGRGMGTACYVWIGLKGSERLHVNNQLHDSAKPTTRSTETITSWPTDWPCEDHSENVTVRRKLLPASKGLCQLNCWRCSKGSLFVQRIYVHYKAQSVNVVQGNTGCLLREPCK